ncbi:hypothetical protein [Bradyrhizobium japonicum]|uniref:hypothetical protein n=1 Tax=Bradyrhizobium japonicum TaxID=375 RepID=UPI00200D6FE1|nr:hypothetical protein [Bradyrhizobium japonicum]UQD96134.1 hypothetical protein JEY30_31835 [Bradyrhizobium japonicum]
MSAANLIVASDGVHLISDALVWDTTDQTITAICPKVVMLPHLRCAATIRAEHLIVFQSVSLVLSTMAAANFDDFKRTIGKALQELDGKLTDMGLCSPFEVSVAGVSEEGGPNGFRITTLARSSGSNHLVPWQVIDMPPGFNPCPCASDADEREIRSALAAAPANLEGHAIAALTAQRRIAARDHVAGRTPCWVGGFAQLTTVTRDSIATRIIRRWDEDVAGHKLGSVPHD